MPLTDDEALALKLNQQVAMGKRIFTVVRHENICGFREPVLVDEKGERISSVLFVAHILNHYTPPKPKVEEGVTQEAQKEEADESSPSATNEKEYEDEFRLI